MAGKVAQRLDAALRSAGVPISGVSVGSDTDRSTWKTQPASVQAAAQPTIDAFNAADPALDATDRDADVKDALDNQRVFSAIVWAILDQFAAPATIAKYNAARTKIIAAYQAQPWKP